MVLLLKLASLLFAALLIVVISSLLAASHTIHGTLSPPLEPRTKLELLTSSNYTQSKNHQKRQSYYNQANKSPSTTIKKQPYRDSKHNYIDENDRDTYLANNDNNNDVRQQHQPIDTEQNLSASSVPIYRSRYHGDGGPIGHMPPVFMGFPGTGFGFGGPGGGGGGATGVHGFGGHGPINPVGGHAGHALGHSISILDPLFLMVTLSFILFLIHSVLGLIDRVRLPVVRARMEDGTGDSEMLDQMVYEFRQAIKKQGEQAPGPKKVQGGQKYTVN